MKYVILSDIHANLEAIEACFRKIDELKPDRIICLGDLVDYGAEPNECSEIIRRNADVVIMGNHDEAQFDYELAENFSENAYISSILTRKIILPELIEYFRTLPRAHIENSLHFVHASPLFPENYQYILNVNEARLNFAHFFEKICFIGHSHLPLVFEKRNYDIKIITSEKFVIKEECSYIINVGSTGQPRDHNPKASFGFFDTDISVYENIRVEYDIQKAAEKILKAGLPEFLAYRLYQGI
ncbi:MAG: metallophosphoesterase family protein [Ignavibacteria bacterium]|nr:metallophosphoesterase family protein [Ignavibacteria bacterium]